MVVTDEDGEELVTSLMMHGMLSPVIDGWKLTYLENWSDWFEFARGLNQTTMEVWMRHWRNGEGGSSAALAPTASRILGRAMNGFCAAVVLCERGAAIEAAGLARGISEASFWLAYLAKAPEAAMSALEADDLKNFMEREAELQRVNADQIELVAESKAREADHRAKLAGRKKPSIAAIARDHGPAEGYLNYRILSGFYGHLSQASLRHNFLSTGEKSGMNILGPHAEQIGPALYFAAKSLIDCGLAYCAISDDNKGAGIFAQHDNALLKLRTSLEARTAS
jgi:hypothetical protein